MAALRLPWPAGSLTLPPDAALRCDGAHLLLTGALLLLLDSLLCLAELRHLVLQGTWTLAFGGRARCKLEEALIDAFTGVKVLQDLCFLCGEEVAEVILFDVRCSGLSVLLVK